MPGREGRGKGGSLGAGERRKAKGERCEGYGKEVKRKKRAGIWGVGRRKKAKRQVSLKGGK